MAGSLMGSVGSVDMDETSLAEEEEEEEEEDLGWGGLSITAAPVLRETGWSIGFIGKINGSDYINPILIQIGICVHIQGIIYC